MSFEPMDSGSAIGNGNEAGWGQIRGASHGASVG